MARIVAQLSDDIDPASLGGKIASANQEALIRITSARPVVVDMLPARKVIPGMSSNTILHAGPPIEWDRMCGPMRGAVIGALLYEGMASSPDEAEKLAVSGEIEFAPCHSRNAVGPMAGIISPSMPVWVVVNETFGNLAFSTMNEGWGRTLRFGAYDDKVIERLKWMEYRLAPAMKYLIERLQGIDLKSIIAQALQMGDECHNRDIAATNLFFKKAAPVLVDSDLDSSMVREVISFLGNHEHFFLNLAMAACKATLDAAENIPYCSVVTAIARNGVEVGIRVSGLGDRWFTEEATIPQGLYFPGYSESDANPDIGDSAITETAGIGAFVMGTAPAIVQFVGGTPEDAVRLTREMYEITVGTNDSYRLPNMSFIGAPTAIDVRKVVETGILPIINTGIAHKEPGHGLVGAGIVRVPRGAFEKALRALAEKYAPEGRVLT
ncbi:DUF1116 domain-containing protein [Moorellaceae bacterium AZ2]|uniref:DUF1116 domain-containing protein n=1 Tax=Thermanaeromonas sp. C210 TaxID=2731925 RepID=UPI0020B762DD|nr:DUF1116 domain-containing protein [Thermanaeromonas sp. C210]